MLNPWICLLNMYLAIFFHLSLFGTWYHLLLFKYYGNHFIIIYLFRTKTIYRPILFKIYNSRELNFLSFSHEILVLLILFSQILPATTGKEGNSKTKSKPKSEKSSNKKQNNPRKISRNANGCCFNFSYQNDRGKAN